MASVYPKLDRKSLPEGAEIRSVRGRKMARFTDQRGRVRTHPLDEDGQHILVQRRCWYIAYVNAEGRRVETKGYTDKEASEQLGRDLERQAERKRAGLDVLDTKKVQAPFLEALELYIQEMEQSGRDADYRRYCKSSLKRLCGECKWLTVASINHESLTRWLVEANRKGMAPLTQNQYISIARMFVNWCIEKEYRTSNPLLKVKKNGSKERKRPRRGLTEDQLRALLGASPKRWLVYLVAMKTGLRRKELRKLEWGDLLLDGDRPCIRLRAGATKAKRGDTIPLDAELVECLRAARPADAKASDCVFTKVPAMRTYIRDLARAGIEYVDGQGRQADFHALRMSYNMLLAKTGAHPRVAQHCMRHTDIRLTMQTYTDPTLLDMHGAVDKLPKLAPAHTNQVCADTGAATAG